MKKALAIALFVWFLLADFLFFHDAFKAEEVVTIGAVRRLEDFVNDRHLR
jgi:hypothetical protein